MIIRIVLLSALAAIGYFGFLRRNRLPVNIIVVFLLLAVAGAAVLMPERTDVIAQWMGVGAGKDLILYLVQALLLLLSLHFYTKNVDHQRQLAQLVREIALLRAEVERHTASSTPPKDVASDLGAVSSDPARERSA
jgi:hypothetical protein